MLDLYINTHPIVINVVDKNNTPKDKLILKFPDKWISTDGGGTKSTGSLFNNKNNSTSKYTEDITIKGNEYAIKHMNLLPYTTIDELKYIVASILKTDYKNILKVYAINDIDFVISEDADRCKDFNWIHSNERLTDFIAYESSLSIGYKEIIIDVLELDRKIVNNYDYQFYNNYLTTKIYIEKMLAHNKSVLTKEQITQMACVQNVEILLAYGSEKLDTINEINITKLFNILHINNNLKKILINDSLLTDFNNEERNTQYIKTLTDMDDPFKNTFSRFNCCSIYVVNEVFPGITLSRIEVYKNALIKCCFMVNDPDIGIAVVRDVMTGYFARDKGKFWRLFNKLHIDECIYNFDYDVNNFVPVYNNISYIYSLDEIKAANFKNSFNLVNQEIPVMVYKTNTSSFLSMYSTFSFGAFYNYYYSRSFHNLVTNITIKADVLSHVHLQALDDKSVVCYISKCFSNDDNIMNALMVLPLFDISKKENKEIENFDNLPPLEKLKIIKKKYQKIPTKKAIKKLIEIDPILFGNRKINEEDYRPYSALAQKKEQRVVSITKKEYDIIYSINPEYVSNIKNQSQGNQRLYLFCPYDGFEYLNYHHYHNQLCIPKCTTGITKRSQYMYCNNQLEAKNVADSSETDVSKMIVYYSPLLLPGRKCKPPEELFMVCENYILLKMDANINLFSYCQDNYKLPPYILTRNNIEKTYIVNTEIEQNQDYVLCIQSELDNLYYIVLSEIDASPYKLSEHNEFFLFLKSIQVNKNIGYNFFIFLDTVLNLNLSSEYINKTFKQLVQDLETVYNIQLITNIKKTYIIAVKYKDVLIFTPRLAYDKNTLTGDYKNINIVLGSSKLPTLDMFESKRIFCYFKDYKDGLIHAIDFGKEVIIPIEPTDKIESGYENIVNVILFDSEAYLDVYRYAASGKLRESNLVRYKDQKELKNILYTLLYIYYNTPLDENTTFKDILTKSGIITDGETSIGYIDEKQGAVSWRDTKINSKEFDDIYKDIENMDEKLLIDIVYRELYDTMNIFYLKDNEMISNKIITNNTL